MDGNGIKMSLAIDVKGEDRGLSWRVLSEAWLLGFMVEPFEPDWWVSPVVSDNDLFNCHLGTRILL